MIHLFADSHYGVHSGRELWRHLPVAWRERIAFHENDLPLLESGKWLEDCELLALHFIGGAEGAPLPGEGACAAARRWCESGGSLLLLHGGSAAFWHCDWWRRLMALRWVRPGDPDGVTPSFHPIHPYRVTPVAGGAHPLAKQLVPMEFPEDEIYAGLQAATTLQVLLETTIPEGCFPQCALDTTPWGGRQLHFLPGHAPETLAVPELVQNVQSCLKYLVASH